jgi:hypothetical protein
MLSTATARMAQYDPTELGFVDETSKGIATLMGMYMQDQGRSLKISQLPSFLKTTVRNSKIWSSSVSP